LGAQGAWKSLTEKNERGKLKRRVPPVGMSFACREKKKTQELGLNGSVGKTFLLHKAARVIERGVQWKMRKVWGVYGSVDNGGRKGAR